MNLEDLTSGLGGLLSGPAAPRSSEPVATFTATQYQDPDTIWAPRSREFAPASRPLPQSGHGFEHEPVSRAERAAQHTAQDAGQSLADRAASIRVALRPAV